MSDDVLLLERDGTLATLTLNRPDKLNAFDPSLRAAMREKVAIIEDDPKIRVVILKGEGRGFSAGADLSAGMADPLSFHLDMEYKPFLTAIAQSNKVWIAQVHGACAGIGAAVAMNCDLMVLAEDSYIYMAFAAIALVPDLYAGQPLVTFAKLAGPPTQVKVRGKTPSDIWQVNLQPQQFQSGVAKLWATRRIEALMDSAELGEPMSEIQPTVLALALEHQVASPFTSFVAVDTTPTRPADAETGTADVKSNLAQGRNLGGSLPRGGTAANLWLLTAVLLAGLAIAVRKRRA